MDIKEYVNTKKQLLKQEIDNLIVKPKLIIIQVNDDPASMAYIKGKKKDLESINASFEHISLPLNTTEEELINVINKYNQDSTVDGILVQMPLPKQISEDRIKEAVSKEKDVDGFHPMSSLVPCTPKGIMDYLHEQNIEFSGKNAVVVGRSNIVGKPVAKLLLDANCNVTILHSRTSNSDMEFYLKHADIIIVAVGRKYFLKNIGLKQTAVVVDVGINRENGKLYGDCEPDLGVALQTPVPGGVGLLTRLAMLNNLLICYKNRGKSDEF